MISELANKKYKNVYWFLIDGLSPMHLNCCGNKKVKRNFFDQIMERGTILSNVASTAGGTHNSMHSIFSSMLPSVNGAIGWDKSTLAKFNPEIFTIADYFQLAGYSTFRYCDADKERTAPMSGFQVWESSGYRIGEILAKTELTKTKRRDEFIRRVVLCHNNKFVYHHVELLHELNGRLGHYWSHEKYEDNITYTANEFEKIYEEYKIADADLVIVSSDHGVVLDKDWCEDAKQNGERHYEQSVRAFFALVGSGIQSQLLDGLVSALDIGPTLMKLTLEMNMPGQGHDQSDYIIGGKYMQSCCYREKGSFNGTMEMRNSLTSDVYYVRDNNWKYVYGLNDSRCEWLINLNEHDDYEKNLKDVYPRIVRKYKNILETVFGEQREQPLQIYKNSNFKYRKRDIPKKFSIIIDGNTVAENAIKSLLDLAGPYYELIVCGEKKSFYEKYRNNYKLIWIEDSMEAKNNASGNYLVFLRGDKEYSEYLLSDIYCKLLDDGIDEIKQKEVIVKKKEVVDVDFDYLTWGKIQEKDIRVIECKDLYEQQKKRVYKKNTIILFGSGNEARRLLNTSLKYGVAYLVDNNKMRNGMYIDNVEVISYEYFLGIWREYDLVLAIKDKKQEIIEQLERDGIPYFDSDEYFRRSQFMQLQDSVVLEKYLYDNDALSVCYSRKMDNWYRDEFYNDRNKNLVEMMKLEDKEGVSAFLSQIYSCNIEYEDEIFSNRPGMRLIKNILENESSSLTICDFACGHGALIRELKLNGHEAYAIDSSEDRTKALQHENIHVYAGDVCDVPFKENMFDVAICLECLEHVENPFTVLKEIKRTLREGGRVFCTVPLGKYNDSVTHVRQFDEASLYSLFYQAGFKVKKMIRIPYVNGGALDNLFIEGEKQE